MPEYRASYRRDARKRKTRTGMQVTNRSVFTLMRVIARRAQDAGSRAEGQPIDNHDTVEPGIPAKGSVSQRKDR